MVGIILLIGVGLVVWKKKVGGASHESFNVITRGELEALLADVGQSNPMLLKRLNEDPDFKKQQIETLQQILAFASQAQREGMTEDPINRQELDNIRIELLAMNYDKEMNKDKGPMPPFGFITEDQINAYWAEDNNPQAPAGFMEKVGLGGHRETRSHDQEFNDFLNAKLTLMKANSPEMQDRELSEEERTQAREVFAKTRLYAREYENKLNAGELSAEFVNKANLQVKLQQAQFLMRLYSEKMADSNKVTDEDVAKYIQDHPELDPEKKRAEAQQILDRAKAGEDFAALANEFSQDPGNKNPDGTMRGGLYEDVKRSQMVAPFEQAALGLQTGEVAPELVETDFGYHIIKLERALSMKENKDGKKEETYDVRHILISTGVKDPEIPNSREIPVKDFVRNKLEKEKRDKTLEDLIAANNIQVPEDFTVPQVSDEQMQQMRQRQMPPAAAPPADVEDTKPEPKKKDDGKKK